jgi:hypothetical protein
MFWAKLSICLAQRSCELFGQRRMNGIMHEYTEWTSIVENEKYTNRMTEQEGRHISLKVVTEMSYSTEDVHNFRNHEFINWCIIIRLSKSTESGRNGWVTRVWEQINTHRKSVGTSEELERKTFVTIRWAEPSQGLVKDRCSLLMLLGLKVRFTIHWLSY